ncbi:MAG: tRNA (5-methylaminomethyl-2-thiouridylate)-methyltransferase [Verrucomicrobiales bacterium]|nr:tRNA (5-methylaminomethyl-2-thiouridylate)-methyltransferase [Verrucomicrobiales bacterium]
MSGGVDSSVAAAVLLKQGHEVVAAYMKNWINEENILGDCPWQQDIEDARAVSERLGIEFRVVNLMADYRERVVKYLLEGYQQGVTPNPDVMCNREIKFGVFLDYALEQGFSAVATGHYARVTHAEENGSGPSRIWRGLDRNKDQTYFLALMRQHQARRALFPIGNLQKAEVRQRAEALGLATAGKKDSQGICFIGQVKMTDFLRAFVPDAPGGIVGTDGRRLGSHRGLHLYTLGQRKGLGVASNTYKEAYVVVEKRPATRELVLAFEHPEAPGLYASRAVVGSLSWVGEPPMTPNEHRRLQAQPRYRCPGQDAMIEWTGEDSLTVRFDQPQRALSPGQICAFYEGDELLGGGIFQEIHTV